jgi:hypothetical protein
MTPGQRREAFLSDWLACDPNRLNSSLYDFIGPPEHLGSLCSIDELRSDIDYFARMLLGYEATARSAGRGCDRNGRAAAR